MQSARTNRWAERENGKYRVHLTEPSTRSLRPPTLFHFLFPSNDSERSALSRVKAGMEWKSSDEEELKRKSRLIRKEGGQPVSRAIIGRNKFFFFFSKERDIGLELETLELVEKKTNFCFEGNDYCRMRVRDFISFDQAPLPPQFPSPIDRFL